MPTTSETAQTLYAALDANERDALLPLADLREETGLPWDAAGFRWLAEHGKWPQWMYPGMWFWRQISWLNADVNLDNETLPALVRQSCGGIFNTASDALDVAANELGKWLRQQAERTREPHAK